MKSPRILSTAVFTAALLSLSAGIVDAQQQTSRWQAWLGCWVPQAAPAASDSAPAVNSLVCVIPGANSSSVQVVNISDNRIVSRVSINTTGEKIQRTVDDCTGWESAEWSTDMRRVMMRSEFTCANGVVRKESGVVAMSLTGEWLQIQNVTVDSNDAVYVGHLRSAGGIAYEGITDDGALIEHPVLDSEGRRLPIDRSSCTGTDNVSKSPDGRTVTVKSDFECGGQRTISDAVFQRSAADGRWFRTDKQLPVFTTLAGRLAVGSPVKVDAIVEMASSVNAPVVEAWLADREQRFNLSGRDLLKLADKGVSRGAIDVLVALDNPRSLSLRSATEAVAVVPVQRGDDRDRVGAVVSGGVGGAWVGGYDDPWLSSWDPYGYRWRYGIRDLSFYHLGVSSGLGCWDCYNYRGGRYNYGYGSPVVVVPRSTPLSGSAVAGKGYSRSTTGGSETTRPRTTTARPSGSEARADVQREMSGSRSSSSSSGGSSSSSSGGRTAKTRGN